VIVFSHGAANDPIDYAHTLERIAAGGFIVAAPYHTNNTQDDVRRDFANAQAGTTVFPCQDGRPAPCSRGGNVPLSMADRVRDIDRVLDQLTVWFGDRVDVGRAGVLGHSRGTVTALAAAGGTFPLTDPSHAEGPRAAASDMTFPGQTGQRHSTLESARRQPENQPRRSDVTAHTGDSDSDSTLLGRNRRGLPASAWRRKAGANPARTQTTARRPRRYRDVLDRLATLET